MYLYNNNNNNHKLFICFMNTFSLINKTRRLIKLIQRNRKKFNKNDTLLPFNIRLIETLNQGESCTCLIF